MRLARTLCIVATALGAAACGSSSSPAPGGTGAAGKGAAGSTTGAAGGTTGAAGAAGSGSGTAGVAGMGSGGNAAGASGNAGATGAAGTGAAGTGAAGATGNTIMGSADGTPFTNATTVLWIGAPDSAASTVVYVFSAPIKCSEISKVGWDTRVADKTQALELKMIGTTAPATFTVVMSPTPAPGQASVNYTLTSQTGTPGEVISSGGTVTLSALKASTSATGSFDLQFGANALKGAFMATYCATGVEP